MSAYEDTHGAMHMQSKTGNQAPDYRKQLAGSWTFGACDVNAVYRACAIKEKGVMLLDK